jgi:hypothetical protein
VEQLTGGLPVMDRLGRTRHMADNSVWLADSSLAGVNIRWCMTE